MAPKRSRVVDGVGVETPTKCRKISVKNTQQTLASLEVEAQKSRSVEQRNYVMAEMALCQKASDQCYSICVSNQRKREGENILHRHITNVGGIALYQRENIVRQISALKSVTFEKICSDKVMLGEAFKLFTNLNANTDIGVTCLPIINFQQLCAAHIKRHGMVDLFARSLVQYEHFDTNFSYGHFGLVPPKKVAGPVDQVRHFKSNDVADLPLTIPFHDIGAVYNIVRWGLEETAQLRGAGGIMIPLLPLFASKKLPVKKPPSSIVQFAEDIDVAMRPPPHNPTQQLSLRPGACNFNAKVPETPVPPLGGKDHSAPVADDVDEPRTLVKPFGLAATHEKGVPIFHVVDERQTSRFNGDDDDDLFADLGALSAAAAVDVENIQKTMTTGNEVHVDLDADLAALSAAAGDDQQ